MRLEIKEIDEQTVLLTLIGDFDIYNTLAVKNTVKELLEKGFLNLIFDFENVPYIDSSGIGSLMVTLSLLKKTSGKLILIHVYDAVKRVMEITKMVNYFIILDSLESAIVEADKIE